MKYFVSGSKSISTLPESIIEVIDLFISLEAEFLVGDCYGVDAAIQKYLESKGYSNVTIYCSGESPRNSFVTGAKVHSCAEAAKGLTGRAFHYVKDIQMATDCDFALVIWDGKSKGSENNIKRILNLDKKHNFFINGSLLWV